MDTGQEIIEKEKDMRNWQRIEHVALGVLTVIAIGLLIALLVRPSPTTPQPPSSSSLPQSSCLSSTQPTAREPYAPGPAPWAYVAPPALFKMHDSWATIKSGFTRDSGLIGWSWPVGDWDYMLPCGARENAGLPGDTRDTYTLAYTGYIIGLGYYESWIAPNGGRFAYVHLSALSYANGARVHGGRVVGVTGWPTDPQYGNGVAGPVNAHLCVPLDAKAKDWFHYVQFRGPPPPPPPVFSSASWYAYLNHHHKRHTAAFSPYYPVTSKRLTGVATAWTTHKRQCGGVVMKWHYYAPPGKLAYTEQRFQTCLIVTWRAPHHTPKVVSKARIR